VGGVSSSNEACPPPPPPPPSTTQQQQKRDDETIPFGGAQYKQFGLHNSFAGSPFDERHVQKWSTFPPDVFSAIEEAYVANKERCLMLRCMTTRLIWKIDFEAKCISLAPTPRDDGEELKRNQHLVHVSHVPISPHVRNGCTIRRRQRFKLRDFEILSLLGVGVSGKVFLVRNKSAGGVYAMKAMPKDMLLGQGAKDMMLLERNILAEIDHPFLTALK
jgi:hypothetical protein